MIKIKFKQINIMLLILSIIFTVTPSLTAFAVNNTVVITQSEGWLESAYVIWSPFDGASGYNIYYKLENADDTQYKKLDSELIRNYNTYYRADALGLVAGNYVLKIVPIINGTEDASAQSITPVLNVKAHAREGFAFSQQSPYKTGSGGYNDDGTVPANAEIIYVTPDTANTVRLDVITSSNGSKTTCTGLADILAKRQKGYDKTPLIIRMIGQVKDTDISGLNSTGYLEIKGCYNITFEGVGDDATVYKWGILIRSTSNIEIRNLGLMLFPDDGISIDTDNVNIWVHNNDIFYGSPGSDADQVKGDGSTDVKGNSTYVTVSYNHYWDSGKSSLCGMTETQEFFVTYHHNWFDHSDSRHPRIRVGTIHIYNNYYDGNSKYGVGVTTGSSAFVEANYFRNCPYPMMSSLQGSDIANGSTGTFSDEAGGMIKAYNNIVEGAEKLVYAPTEPVQFDAYLTNSRDEQVPSTYKTVSGGTTYNNFDTASTMYSYTPDSPENVKSVVTTYSGRVDGGDFKWTFTPEDDASHTINTALKDALLSYSTGWSSNRTIVSVTVPSDIVVVTGATPSLPSTVSVTYSDGNSGQAIVTWDTADTSAVGKKTVHGSITGYSDGVDITVNVIHKADLVITSVLAPKVITAFKGSTANLPATVTATYNDGSTEQVPVTWGTVDTSVLGTVTLHGSVTGYSVGVDITVIIIDAASDVFYDDFSNANSSNFFTPLYKAITGYPDIPMYDKTGGTITANASSVILDGGRMTIGALAGTATTANTTPGGIFDLSHPYKIILQVGAASGIGNFQVFVDNNTTSTTNSINGSASKVYESLATDIASSTITITPSDSLTGNPIGTTSSFIQVRTESGSTIELKSITLKYDTGVQTYDVTFNTDGGSTINSINVETNSKVTIPAEPTKDGYVFGGWYKDSNYTNAWNFDTDIITDNTTLYAKWVLPFDITSTYSVENNILNVNATVINNNVQSVSPDIIIAVYDASGVLCDAKVVHSQISAKSQNTTNDAFDINNITGVSYKIFAFENLTNIKPLINSYSQVVK